MQLHPGTGMKPKSTGSPFFVDLCVNPSLTNSLIQLHAKIISRPARKSHASINSIPKILMQTFVSNCLVLKIMRRSNQLLTATSRLCLTGYQVLAIHANHSNYLANRQSTVYRDCLVSSKFFRSR